jgi:glycosyltransferase involved in cell wall biosynthesis
LKRLATLGEVLAREIPTHVGLLKHKYDWRVLGRLTRLFQQRDIDAVVTVGTGGDRMFWGRLAAWRAGVPVILSSLHSTGYPQKVERLNRWLAPISDGFIGCARMHSQYLVDGEGCPADKVFTVYNGVDTEKFSPQDRFAARETLGIPASVPVAGIVAALRPEKQHGWLVEAWKHVVDRVPDAILLIVGDGSERAGIEQRVAELDLGPNVWMMGNRHDVPDVLAAMNVKVLTSRMEANPASTLEAASCGLPVIAPDVGSLRETVLPEETGLLYSANDREGFVSAVCRLLQSPQTAETMGQAGRNLVTSRFSLATMVSGYEQLIEGIYRAACNATRFTPDEFDSVVRCPMLVVGC